MSARKCCFAFLLAMLSTAGFQALPNPSIQLWAAPPADKFEDLAQFNYTGGFSATSIKDKGGFTMVPLDAAAGGSKLSMSFAVKEDQERTSSDLSDFRVVAVDTAGKRHQASAESKVSARGNGIVVITVVSEFNLSSDKIDSLVIQQRARDKK